SPVTHCTADDDPKKNKSGSIGPPLPNTECRVVDYTNGRDVGTGEDGEVWIRGPQVMRGYLNNPQATEMTIDSDGWLHSGDVGLRQDPPPRLGRAGARSPVPARLTRKPDA